MAETVIFHYRKTGSFLNKCNPLSKVAALITVCILLQGATLFTISLFLISIILTMVATKIPVHQFIPELFFFIFLTGLIFGTNYFPSHNIFRASEKAGAFFTAVLASLILTDSTDPSDLARSLGSFLTRLHIKGSWTFAFQIELTLTCIPLIFDSYKEVHQARIARLSTLKRHPIQELLSSITLLMETLLNQIDEMAFALDSRGFQPDQKRESLPYTQRDLVLIGIMVILGLVGRYGIYVIKG